MKGRFFQMKRSHYNRFVNRFAIATACATFFLIIAGGMVTSTGSGLAVPDWPLSYGQLMPPMVGGIFYEHGHRMVATFVGLLTVILTVVVWRKEVRRWVRVLTLLALAAVIIQGMLGGLTVLFLLPAAISISHATLAQTFFCITVTIAFVTSRWWTAQENAADEVSRTFSGSGIFVAAFGAVYLQLILGALMRHTGSGLTVPDFPLAYGQVFPSLGEESIAQYNQFLIQNHIRLAADGPITESQIIIHLVHRYWAIVVTALVVVASIRLFSLSGASARFRLLGILLLMTVGAQIALGGIVVLSGRNPELTTAHVANGALILALCLLAVLHMIPFSAHFREKLGFAMPEGRVAIL
jgi:cytochrome c oxidase assembly protein subunit 15